MALEAFQSVQALGKQAKNFVSRISFVWSVIAALLIDEVSKSED
jgi:hypothetical protein